MKDCRDLEADHQPERLQKPRSNEVTQLPSGAAPRSWPRIPVVAALVFALALVAAVVARGYGLKASGWGISLELTPPATSQALSH